MPELGGEGESRQFQIVRGIFIEHNLPHRFPFGRDKKAGPLSGGCAIGILQA